MINRFGLRKSEMWISNNKVLIGGATKKPHARNPNFETEETKLLISLWGDPKVQKTLITTHKKHPVIAKLADKMREHGYYRSPEEINTRIKNLKCFYNRIKKDMEVGVTTEPSWRHYASMDEILTRPIFGNRVQQPHLQIQQVSTDTKADDEPKELRPEDLLSVEEEMEDEIDFDDNSIIPKDEPIDIDDMEDIPDDMIEETEEDEEFDDDGEPKAGGVEHVNEIFPKLSYYLQLTSNSALKGSGGTKATSDSPPLLNITIKTSPPSSPIPEDDTIETAASPATTVAIAKVAQTTTTTPTTATKMILTTAISASSLASSFASTSTHTSTAATTNKISLVPTNMLMKPTVTTQATGTTTQFSFKPQQFLTTGTSTNGGPMKVLLVNTLPPTSTGSVSSVSSTLTTRSLVNIQPKIQVSTATSAATPYQTRSATANAVNSPKNFIYTTSSTASAASSTTFAEKRNNAWRYEKKNAPGFRTLLYQLVQLQNKTLDYSRQRLDVEKQRLKFEKETAGKILDVLSGLLPPRPAPTEE